MKRSNTRSCFAALAAFALLPACEIHDAEDAVLDGLPPGAPACGTLNLTAPSAPTGALAPGRGLVWTTNFAGTGTLVGLDLGNPGGASPSFSIDSGDVAVRTLGDAPALLLRGKAGSLVLLDAALEVLRQIALPGCNPYDALLVADDRALVTCYDEAALRLVDLTGSSPVCGVYLDRLADTDDPIAEMDQLARVGDRIYVTLARLDASFKPRGAGRVAVLDATTLDPIDLDPATAGTQGLDLPCQNPFGALLVDGTDLLVGCSGDYFTPETFGVVRVDTTTMTATYAVDGTTLGAAPVEIALGPAGALYGLIYNAGIGDEGEMGLLRLDGTLTSLYAVEGFNLSGVAVGPNGEVVVGNRQSDADRTGVWLLGAPDARILAVDLPPAAILLY